MKIEQKEVPTQTIVKKCQRRTDKSMNLFIYGDIIERMHQAASSRIVKWVFGLTILLLFLLPLYDLVTGNLSNKIRTMLIVSSSLLIYVYIIICMIGKWNKNRQLMEIPRLYFVWIIVLFLTCILSFYRDFFVATSHLTYLIPVGIAMAGLVAAMIRCIRIRKKLKNRLVHKKE